VFVSGVLEALQCQGTSRQVQDAGDHYELREPEEAYHGLFAVRVAADRLN